MGLNLRLPSVQIIIYRNSIHTLGGRDAISFYDCLCKTEPQTAQAIM